MSDQGEPVYEAYALCMVVIISELRSMNKMLSELLQIQTNMLELKGTVKRVGDIVF